MNWNQCNFFSWWRELNGGRAMQTIIKNQFFNWRAMGAMCERRSCCKQTHKKRSQINQNISIRISFCIANKYFFMSIIIWNILTKCSLILPPHIDIQHAEIKNSPVRKIFFLRSARIIKVILIKEKFKREIFRHHEMLRITTNINPRVRCRFLLRNHNILIFVHFMTWHACVLITAIKTFSAFCLLHQKRFFAIYFITISAFTSSIT
jgi:hypothetical protein